MAVVNKIDSNATGLRYAEETSLDVLPGTPNWIPLEPNSYSDFGGEVTTVARNPINPSRQRKKGVLTDLDASGGFNTDLTQENLQDILQGFFFADLREKGVEEPTAATATTDLYTVAATAGFLVGSLINGTGFDDAGNNVVAEPVTAVVLDTSVEVLGATLVTDGTPATGAQINVVGHVFAPNDATAFYIDVTGSLPRLITDLIDLTTLGLTPGEWIFIGGDGADSSFSNAANNGFKRIRSISATEIEFDKSDSAMVADDGSDTGAAGTFDLDIELYFGRVLKNETGSSIVRRSYNLERQLGAPDDSLPAEIQAEYIEGAVPSEATFNISTADKLTVDLSFVGVDNSTIDGATALKTGTRPALAEADAFNTSSDFSRIKMAQVVTGSEAPTALFAFAQEITLELNNNVSPNKAVGTLGSFEVTAGTFEVGGSITAYFADVAAITAIRNNVDITLDFIIVKANSGIAVDLPLISLGDGRPDVSQDEPITLPLDMSAATGAKVDTNLDHTMLLVFFDYLPDAADT